ncbi:unnamed protein product, partial [Urochloa humidicola]
DFRPLVTILLCYHVTIYLPRVIAPLDRSFGASPVSSWMDKALLAVQQSEENHRFLKLPLFSTQPNQFSKATL